MNTADIPDFGLVRSIAATFNVCGAIDHDDLVQEGAIALMAAREAFSPERGKFSTFATTCIRNRLIRRSKWMTGPTRGAGALGHTNFDSDTEAQCEQSSRDVQCGLTEEPAVDDIFLDLERLSARLREAIDELAPRERTVITEVFFEGQTYDAVATHLDLSRSHCQNLRDKAIAQLRKRLCQ